MTHVQSSIFDDLSTTVTASGKVVLSRKNEPSPYQQAILDHLRVPGPNLIVRATAGSGKTSLLEMIAKQLIDTEVVRPGGARALFLAFNKHTAKTLEERLPAQVSVQTLNSLGYEILKENVPTAEFDPKKYEKLVAEAVENRGYARKEARLMRQALAASVEISMQHLILLGCPQDMWQEIMDEFDVDVRIAPDDLYALTQEVITRGMDVVLAGQVSFLDQTYAAFFYEWTLQTPYDFILIDEAQDLSRAQAGIVLGASGLHTRIVAVGDAAQALYFFGGANPQSLTELRESLEAVELPLSVTYRCPKKHVALASAFTDAIEAAPGAPDGVLGEVDGTTFVNRVQPSDLVLCRVNAPLVKWAYRLIRSGRRAHVRGKDVSGALVKLARNIAVWDGQALHPEKLKEPITLEAGAFFAAQKSLFEHELKALEARQRKQERVEELEVDALRDRYNSLHLIYREKQPETLDDLIKVIRELFREDKSAVTLSSIHRAKGLEADTVYILEPDLLPHPAAKSPTAQTAERAVQFVAFTRARSKLFFVDAEHCPIPEHLRD
ncbi:UvrD-helicase domain-containing protein [Deinococcus ficus]|nr:UvrD-helicase domain-containing protein [Deinococcus ficus]